MIITVTGKPCSGKGSVSKHFCAEYGFKYMSTGNMFRELAKQNGYDDILEFQMNESITKIDNQVDSLIENLGKEKLHEDIVIDSRLAWHFIPKSFKVFIDVDWRTAGERLLRAERETEKAENLEHAIKILKKRWKTENDRYSSLYKINNLDISQYDLVIKSDNKTIEEISREIYLSYKKFMQKA